MFELHPPTLELHGLALALRQLGEQSAGDAGFAVTVEAPDRRYPLEVEVLAYRRVVEALSNARKHSQASRVTVAVREDGGYLRGEVADDGRGFDLERALASEEKRLHIGLSAMMERIRLVGGEPVPETAPGQGTRIGFSILLVDARASRAPSTRGGGSR